MTSTDSSPAETTDHGLPLEERLEAAGAAERRLQATMRDKDQLAFNDDHELRQSFRKLIHPGIMRHNSKETALAAMKVCDPDQCHYVRLI
jgi:hypothetical protein